MSRWNASLADDPARLIPAVDFILRQEHSHKAAVFNTAFWHWQYGLRPSFVYVLRDETGEIGGYYHVPTYEMEVEGKIRTAGVIQDVAVMPTARGKGEFRKLAEFAHADLPQRGIDFIYTYPNEKSIHTFLKYNGYRNVLTYDAWLLALRPKQILDLKIKVPVLGAVAAAAVNAYTRLRTVKVRADAMPIHRFDDEHARLFASKPAPVRRLRSAAYLNWRYFDRPAGEHRAYWLKCEEKKALVVYKKDVLFERPALIVMDFAGDAKTLAALIRQTAHDADLVFVAGRSPLLGALATAGFVKIPQRFNPRPLHHLVLDFGGHPIVYDAAAWELSLGDWDVF
jgi:GNAT superfamily N-acetyltransferase